MTRLLYESDPYMTRFDATVEKLNGDWVALDRTAFFPGGGGQDMDSGWIEDLDVVEVKEQEEIWHRVPDHAFSVGQRVEAEVDWERRHDLMRGHTGEHLLFSAMNKINPELELVKIAITPKKKSFIVRGEMSWALLARAQTEANAAIVSQLPITEVWVSKDSPIIKEIRVKVERIHGDKIRIISIGDIINTRPHILLYNLLITDHRCIQPSQQLHQHLTRFIVPSKTNAQMIRHPVESILKRQQFTQSCHPGSMWKKLFHLRSNVKSLISKHVEQAISCQLRPLGLHGDIMVDGRISRIDRRHCTRRPRWNRLLHLNRLPAHHTSGRKSTSQHEPLSPLS